MPRIQTWGCRKEGADKSEQGKTVLEYFSHYVTSYVGIRVTFIMTAKDVDSKDVAHRRDKKTPKNYLSSSRTT